MKPVRPADCNNKNYVEVIKTEEKGSDVNLAAHLLMDAFNNKFDAAIVISNDSDLMLPVQIAKQKLNKFIFVLNPHPNDSFQLKRWAHIHKKITPKDLAPALFPNHLTDAAGTFSKPTTW